MPLPIYVTHHAVQRFRDRVVPRMEAAQIRQYLADLLSPYSDLILGVRGVVVESRYGQLRLVVARVPGAEGAWLEIITVMRPRGSRRRHRLQRLPARLPARGAADSRAGPL